MRLVWILGASGSGKTTLCKMFEEGSEKETSAFLTLDSIHDERDHPFHSTHKGMAPNDWQRAITLEWAKRIAALGTEVKLVVMDGQSRWEFIREACRETGLPDASIILIHCADEAREERLRARGNPELADEAMRGWARWLLAEANKEGSPVLDTTALDLDEAKLRLKGIIGSCD